MKTHGYIKLLYLILSPFSAMWHWTSLGFPEILEPAEIRLRTAKKKKKKMVVGGCMDSLHVHTRIYLHPTYRNTYTQICMSSEHNNKFTYQHNPLKFNEWPKKKIEYWVLWYTLISGRGTQLSEKSFACSGEWVPSVDDPQC